MYGSEFIASWDEIYEVVCKRFDNRDDIMKEFKKLVQEGYVDEYVEEFKELKSLMHVLNPLLP
jgi:hypothetical protein